MCVCVVLMPCAVGWLSCVCNPCGNRGWCVRFNHSPNRGGESGRHTQPWSSTVLSGCSSLHGQNDAYNVQYSPWGYTMDSPFSRMESREMFV